MGFPRQEYWSALPFPSPGDLPVPGIEPGSPVLQADSLLSEPPGKPSYNIGQDKFKKEQQQCKQSLCFASDKILALIFFFDLTLFLSTYVFSPAYCFGSISAMLCCRQSSRNSVLTGLYCLVRAMLLWPLVEPWLDSSSSAIPSPSLQGGPAVAASAVSVALFPDFSRRVTQHDSATWI